MTHGKCTHHSTLVMKVTAHEDMLAVRAQGWTNLGRDQWKWAITDNGTTEVSGAILPKATGK